LIGFGVTVASPFSTVSYRDTIEQKFDISALTVDPDGNSDPATAVTIVDVQPADGTFNANLIKFDASDIYFQTSGGTGGTTYTITFEVVTTIPNTLYRDTTVAVANSVSFVASTS
jgi:hypothetical protein